MLNNGERLTSGFAQVWPDKLNFSIFAWSGCGSGLDKQIWALVLNFNKTKLSAAVPGRQLENSTPAQSRGTLGVMPAKSPLHRKSLKMKTLYLAVFLFSSLSIKANSQFSFIDTIDFWHVFYNNKLIKEYNVHNSEKPVILKISSLKEDDSITVKYFRDTPSNDCNAYLIIEYPFLNRAFIAHGTYTFCPLSISLSDLKKAKEFMPNSNSFQVYYLEDTNNTKIKLFELKLE